MCLTAKAFGLFLSIISLDNVSVTAGEVTIHTPEDNVVWLAVGPLWCTAAPDGYVLADLNLPRVPLI